MLDRLHSSFSQFSGGWKVRSYCPMPCHGVFKGNTYKGCAIAILGMQNAAKWSFLCAGLMRGHIAQKIIWALFQATSNQNPWTPRNSNQITCIGEVSSKTTKNNYSNSIRVGYDRVEQIREGVSGHGLEGNFWEEGLPSCIQLKLECLHG